MKMSVKLIALTTCAAIMLTGGKVAEKPVTKDADSGSAKLDLELNTDTKEATKYTIDANDQVYALLDFEDEKELENAH